MSTTTHDTEVRDPLDRARAGHEDVLDDDVRDRLADEIERTPYDGTDPGEVAQATVDALAARIERDPASDAAASVAREDHRRRVTGERPPEDEDALGAASRDSFREAVSRATRLRSDSPD